MICGFKLWAKVNSLACYLSWFLLLWEKHHDQKQPGEKKGFVSSCNSQVSTVRHWGESGQEHGGRDRSRSHRGLLYQLAPHRFLYLLFCTIEDPSGGDAAHSELHPPMSIVNPDNAQLTTGQSYGDIFPNWETLFRFWMLHSLRTGAFLPVRTFPIVNGDTNDLSLLTTLLWFSLLPALLLCLTLVSFFLVRVLCYPKYSNCLQPQELYICSSVYSFQFPPCPKVHLLASLRNTQCLILMVSSFSSRTGKWSACSLSYKAPILTLALHISLIQDNPFRRWTIFSLCCSIWEPPARCRDTTLEAWWLWRLTLSNSNLTCRTLGKLLNQIPCV